MVEELRVPRFPWLYFGDGTVAQLLNHKVDIDSDGTEIVVLRFKPTQALKQKYSIKPEELDMDGAITKKYPKEFFVAGDRTDPIWSAWFLECNYLGQETELSNRRIDLLTMIRGYKKYIATLKAELAFMHDTLRKARSEIPEWARTYTEIQKAITPKRDRGDEDEKNPYAPPYED
ncbi:MAG: hypothetical protein J7K29_03050 [Candidatus Cloacimonetes bacterium]|nr:hypothetical protein [Candidatus Cloacimonadota bacterium]